MIRRKLTTIALAAIPVTLLAALIVGGYLWHRTMETIRNSYAVWWVADMVIEHMDASGGRWPGNWDDLRQPYDTCVEKSGQPWSFEELQSRVDVDWSADPDALARFALKEERPAFRVIWLRDGTDSHWESHEPNTIIFDYLRHRHRSFPASAALSFHRGISILWGCAPKFWPDRFGRMGCPVDK